MKSTFCAGIVVVLALGLTACVATAWWLLYNLMVAVYYVTVS